MRTKSKFPQLRHIRKRYLRLYASVLILADTKVDESNFDNLITVLSDALPDINSENIAICCSYLIGKVLTKSEISELCWRLSANYRILLSGEPVLPWAGQQIDDDCIAQVLDIYSRNRCSLCLTFRVLTGPLAAAKFATYISRTALYRLARAAGFTGISGRYPFSPQKLHELRKLIFGCRLSPSFVESRFKISIVGLAAIPTCVKHNRRIIYARQKAIGCAQYRHSKCVACNRHTCPAFGNVFLEGD